MTKTVFTELEEGVYYSDGIIDWMDNITPFEDDVEDVLRKFIGDYALFPNTVQGTYRTNYTDVMVKMSEDGSIMISLASEQEQ